MDEPSPRQLAIFAYGVLAAGAATAQSPCFQPQAAYPVGTTPTGIALGDLDADGRVDFVTANRDSNDLSIYLGDGSGGFLAASPLPTGTGAGSVAMVDLDADGDSDIANANLFGDTVSVFLGDGDGNFTLTGQPTVGGKPAGVLHGDVDGDGFVDLLIPNSEDSSFSVLIGDGAGGFEDQAVIAVQSDPWLLAVQDLDNDGQLDVASTSYQIDSVSIVFGDGAGSFGPWSPIPVGSTPTGIATADLASDGGIDIITANNGSFDLSVLPGDGSGAFAPAVSYPLADAPIFVAVGQLNAGLDLDIATANHFASCGGCGTTVTVLPGLGDGGLGSPLDLPSGLGPKALAIGDLNGQGHDDMVCANKFSSDASVFLAACSGAPQVDLYGCGTNPPGSLQVLVGAPQIGTTLVLGIDNPLGTQAVGSLPFVGVSAQPDPSLPCGLLVPGFGMAGGGAPGELLIDLTPPNIVSPLFFNGLWAGPGLPAPVLLPIPSSTNLVGVTFYAQGVLVDPTPQAIAPIGLTEGAALLIGP